MAETTAPVEPVVGEPATTGTPDTGGDPASVGLCSVCYPDGLPEGYLTAGCEHSA